MGWDGMDGGLMDGGWINDGGGGAALVDARYGTAGQGMPLVEFRDP